MAIHHTRFFLQFCTIQFFWSCVGKRQIKTAWTLSQGSYIEGSVREIDQFQILTVFSGDWFMISFKPNTMEAATLRCKSALWLLLIYDVLQTKPHGSCYPKMQVCLMIAISSLSHSNPVPWILYNSENAHFIKFDELSSAPLKTKGQSTSWNLSTIERTQRLICILQSSTWLFWCSKT